MARHLFHCTHGEPSQLPRVSAAAAGVCAAVTSSVLAVFWLLLRSPIFGLFRGREVALGLAPGKAFVAGQASQRHPVRQGAVLGDQLCSPRLASHNPPPGASPAGRCMPYATRRPRRRLRRRCRGHRASAAPQLRSCARNRRGKCRASSWGNCRGTPPSSGRRSNRPTAGVESRAPRTRTHTHTHTRTAPP